MKIVDLRSDTVTKPTPEMREAMYRAEVGDDVYGEDPTVNKLEELSAAKLGFAAGLFVGSGTMGNLVGVLTHIHKGEEVILEEESHIYYYEAGGISALGGAMPRLIKGERGRITPQMVREAHRGPNIHFPVPTLLCIENTHNRGGGSVTRPAQMAATIDCAHELGLKVHIDGARIFNAAAACGCDVKEVVKGADSVQFCLSKGLGAPMGSLLVGSREYIDQARRWRKMIGGGFRQVGVVAAAGLVALESMTDRLAEDHRLAKKLAEGLAEIPYLTVNPDEVETNIVVIHLNEDIITVPQFLLRLKEHGIKVNGYGGNRVRFVTHFDVQEADIDYTLQCIAKIV